MDPFKEQAANQQPPLHSFFSAVNALERLTKQACGSVGKRSAIRQPYRRALADASNNHPMQVL